jgi:hypothetical protein
LRSRAAWQAVLPVLLLFGSGCRGDQTLRAGSEGDARAAAHMLRRMGIAAEVALRPTGSVQVPETQAAAAAALLTDTGFGLGPPPMDTPLVAGPTESARRGRDAAGLGLQAALRALPHVLNCQVVDGPGGAAVLVWHAAARPPGAEVFEAARAVFGPGVRVVTTPAASREFAPAGRTSLEVPLALLALALAVALGLVASRRRRSAVG